MRTIALWFTTTLLIGLGTPRDASALILTYDYAGDNYSEFFCINTSTACVPGENAYTTNDKITGSITFNTATDFVTTYSDASGTFTEYEIDSHVGDSAAFTDGFDTFSTENANQTITGDIFISDSTMAVGVGDFPVSPWTISAGTTNSVYPFQTGPDLFSGGLVGDQSVYSLQVDGLARYAQTDQIGSWSEAEFSVPEPASIAILGISIACLSGVRRWRSARRPARTNLGSLD